MSGDERFEGVDRGILDRDTWGEDRPKVKCPVCFMRSDAGTVRCPRCNAMLLSGCGGSCASCGLGSCAKRDER